MQHLESGAILIIGRPLLPRNPIMFLIPAAHVTLLVRWQQSLLRPDLPLGCGCLPFPQCKHGSIVAGHVQPPPLNGHNPIHMTSAHRSNWKWPAGYLGSRKGASSLPTSLGALAMAFLKRVHSQLQKENGFRGLIKCALDISIKSCVLLGSGN